MKKILFRILEIIICILFVYLDVIISEYLYNMFFDYGGWWNDIICCPLIFLNACISSIYIIYMTIYDIFISPFGYYDKLFNYIHRVKK